MSEKIHISLLLSVVSYILIVTLLYQNTEKINKFTIVSVNTEVGIKLWAWDEQENTCIKIKKQYHRNNPEIQWLKYGEEKTDWALVINNRMCVEKSEGDKKKLVIYSSEKLNPREVSAILKLDLDMIKIYLYTENEDPSFNGSKPIA